MRIRTSVATCMLLAGCATWVACSVDARKFRVQSPSQIPVVIAPDLPTLNALFSTTVSPPSGAISVPDGTKGRMLDRKFLRGGKLVDPYPANFYDMERDGAVEVAFFEITEGPQRGLRGWIQISFLTPDFWYL